MKREGKSSADDGRNSERDGAAPEVRERNDTVKLSARTWQPPPGQRPLEQPAEPVRVPPGLLPAPPARPPTPAAGTGQTARAPGPSRAPTPTPPPRPPGPADAAPAEPAPPAPATLAPAPVSSDRPPTELLADRHMTSPFTALEFDDPTDISTAAPKLGDLGDRRHPGEIDRSWEANLVEASTPRPPGVRVAAVVPSTPMAAPTPAPAPAPVMAPAPPHGPTAPGGMSILPTTAPHDPTTLLGPTAMAGPRGTYPAADYPPLGPHEGTDLIRRLPSATRAIVVTAAISSSLGLGIGFLLWGAGEEGAPPASAAAASTGAEEEPAAEPVAAEEPAAAEPAAAEPVAAEPATEEPVAAAVAQVDEACSIAFASSPEGAQLFAGSERLGETPYEGPAPCGEVVFRLRHPRYQNTEHRATVVAGERAEIEARLERPTMELRVTSKPPGATVKIGNRVAGKTPLVTRVEGFVRVKVEVTMPGYAPWSRVVYPRSKSSRVQASLQREAKKRPAPRRR